MSLDRQLGRMVDQGLDVRDAFAVLVEKGLGLSDVLAVLADRRSERDLAFVDTARALHGVDGELEVDDVALVSGSDSSAGGEYVMAWVWVDADDVAGLT